MESSAPCLVVGLSASGLLWSLQEPNQSEGGVSLGLLRGATAEVEWSRALALLPGRDRSREGLRPMTGHRVRQGKVSPPAMAPPAVVQVRAEDHAVLPRSCL